MPHRSSERIRAWSKARAGNAPFYRFRKAKWYVAFLWNYIFSNTWLQPLYQNPTFCRIHAFTPVFIFKYRFQRQSCSPSCRIYHEVWCQLYFVIFFKCCCCPMSSKLEASSQVLTWIHMARLKRASITLQPGHLYGIVFHHFFSANQWLLS